MNNFTTLLGQSVGQVFGALFPPAPQFRGRQVVTLHNQRDFLFFRRHRYVCLTCLPAIDTDVRDRYVFDSPTKARLQEIGPRFTLKLRWLKKGLPSVTAPDGRIAHGGDAEPTQAENEEMRRQEKAEEDDAMGELGKAPSAPQEQGYPVIPPLDQEQEYEWKWKVCLPLVYMVSRWDGADIYSQRWRSPGVLSSCRPPMFHHFRMYSYSPYVPYFSSYLISAMHPYPTTKAEASRVMIRPIRYLHLILT